ncbi:MAG: hypothetical protein LH624_07070, partial [Cryobacterium sp.]|nr:hypothetical protein [Cryobacterium sp.]
MHQLLQSGVQPIRILVARSCQITGHHARGGRRLGILDLRRRRLGGVGRALACGCQTLIVGPPLYFSHPACLGHETGEHPESPSRIQAIEAELERRGWLGYERREAPAAPLDSITAVHAEAYVEAVRSRSAGRGSLDGETVLSPGSYRAALHAAGGACAM